MKYCAHINNAVKWEESKHKRDKDGRFSKTGGGGASASDEEVRVGSVVDPSSKRRSEQRFHIKKDVQDKISKLKDQFNEKELRSFEQNYQKMSRTQNPDRAKEKAQLLVNLLKRKGLNLTVDDLIEDRQGTPAPKPKPEPKPTPAPKPEPKPEPKTKTTTTTTSTTPEPLYTEQELKAKDQLWEADKKLYESLRNKFGDVDQYSWAAIEEASSTFATYGGNIETSIGSAWARVSVRDRKVVSKKDIQQYAELKAKYGADLADLKGDSPSEKALSEEYRRKAESNVSLSAHDKKIINDYDKLISSFDDRYRGFLHGAAERLASEGVTSERDIVFEAKRVSVSQPFKTDKEQKAYVDYVHLLIEKNGTPSKFNNKRLKNIETNKDFYYSAKAIAKLNRQLEQPFNGKVFKNLESASSRFNDPYENNPRVAPKEFAGTKRGRPMSISVADTGNANPERFSKDTGFTVNCQTCVPTFELRCRGYDVVATKNTQDHNSANWFLSCNCYEIFLDPKTKKPRLPKWESGVGLTKDGLAGSFVVGNNVKSDDEAIRQTVDYFDKAPIGRYNFIFRYTGSAHTVNVIKDKRGARVIDAQNNGDLTINVSVAEYLRMNKTFGIKSVEFSRIDDTVINPRFENLFQPRFEV